MNFWLVWIIFNLLIGGVIAFMLWLLRGKHIAPIAMAIFGGLYAFLLIAFGRAASSGAENMGLWLFALLIPVWPFTFTWISVWFILGLFSSFISEKVISTTSEVLLLILWIVLGYYLGKYLERKKAR